MFVRGRWCSVLPVLLSFALSAGAAGPPKPDPADVDAAVREALKAWGVPAPRWPSSATARWST